MIDRNRSLHFSAEDCSEASRFICLQLGDHKTEGASRWLIFFFFFLNQAAFIHPASCAGLITWEKRRPQSERPEQGTVPKLPPLPFGDAPLPVRPKGIPEKLGFVVSSQPRKASPAVLQSPPPQGSNFKSST